LVAHASHIPEIARISRSFRFGTQPHCEQRGSKLRAFAFQSSHDMISLNLASATLISVSAYGRHAVLTPLTHTKGPPR